MDFNGEKTREWKDGRTEADGTRALGSLFNAEFNRLYDNCNWLQADIDFKAAAEAAAREAAVINLSNRIDEVAAYGMFTFVVDSNEKLRQWATNEAGNDYSSVYIAAGEYTYTGYTHRTGGGTMDVDYNNENCYFCIPLSATGTKKIVGHPNSKLSFELDYDVVSSGVGRRNWGAALGYDTIDQICTRQRRNTSSMTDVHIEIYCRPFLSQANPNTLPYVSGFQNCVNMRNCTAKVTNSYDRGTFGARHHAIGFASCVYLTDCSAYALSGIAQDPTQTGIPKAIGFAYCSFCRSCYGRGEGRTNGLEGARANGVGFEGGFNIRESICGQGFINCIGIGVGRGRHYNNNANFYEYGTGTGFSVCGDLLNCAGQGAGDGDSGVNMASYGFGRYNVGVRFCRAHGHCQYAVFHTSTCSAIAGRKYSDYNATYACANTPNGGFNDTINPA